MRKLELRMEDLVVESFETNGGARSRGTIFGRDTLETAEEGGSTYQTCQQWDTCMGEKTCNFGGTCYTWNGGWTCEGDNCDPTDRLTCTCPEEA